MQDFLNEHLGSHWLGSSKSKNVLQTQVLSNDQPDSYVFAKDFREAEIHDKLLLESGDLFVTKATTNMNEWLKKKVVSEMVRCFLIKWKQK